MAALVIYESMFGNTRRIAEAIAAGLSARHNVALLTVRETTPALICDAELVVVGGPTHLHGLSRPSSREASREAAAKPESTVTLEPGAIGPGLREWLDSLGAVNGNAAAFDTRLHGPGFFTGRAGKIIARELRRRGAQLVAAPESFFVDRHNALFPGEGERALQWGSQLGATIVTAAGIQVSR